MPPDAKITIVRDPDEARTGLDDGTLIHLTNRVNKIERDDELGLAQHETALRIHALLTSDEDDRHARIREIDPAFGPIEHMKGLRDRGHIVIAKDAGKTVGMVGFQFRAVDPVSGRNVFELRRMGVRKEYEGQGIGSRLHNAVLERVREVDPDCLVIADAQDPGMMKICRNMGYRPCEPREGIMLQSGRTEIDEEHLRWYEQTGGQFFVFDPASGKGEPR